jgi:hypothetical protein
MSDQPVGIITGGGMIIFLCYNAFLILTAESISASGMGLATAERLVQRGWNIAILDVNVTAGIKVAEKYAGHMIFIKCNVTLYNEQAQAFDHAYQKWKRVDFGKFSAPFLQPCSMNLSFLISFRKCCMSPASYFRYL